MTAAERLAALRALKEGLNAAIEDAENDVQAARDLTGAKSFDTRYGLVGYSIYPDTFLFDEAGFLAWAVDNAPSHVTPERTVTTVHKAHPDETLRRDIGKRCVGIGDDVFDALTGEPLPFATCRRGRETLTVKLKPSVKLEAADLVRARIDDVTALMQIEGA